MKHRALHIALLILITLPVLLPLFQQGFFQTDDGEWMIIRFSAFFQAFRDGQIPVRFLERLNFGYGYPVANFLYPGYMYLGIPIHVLGFNFVDTIKILIGASLLFSGIFCYFWLARIVKSWHALVGALFYVYTPYHLYDAYTRGSVGELLALAIIPFILWQFERRSILWSSLGGALLLISHNTLAALIMPFLIAYIFIHDRKPFATAFRETFYFLLFSIGMSAFFWFPVLFELRSTVFASVVVSDIHRYFASADLIGISSFIVLGISLATFFQLNKTNNKRLHLFFFFLLYALLSVFFSSSYSAFLWKVLPSSLVQFPFRLLSNLLIAISFLAAYSLSYFPGKKSLPILVILVVSLLISYLPYREPKEYFDKSDIYYSTNEDTTTVKNEYMPVWVKEKPPRHFAEKVEIINGTGRVSDVVYNAKAATATLFLETPSKVRINTIYYPGWIASIDGRETEITYDNNYGVMDVAVQRGTHRLQVTFTETPLRLFSDGITVLSFAGLILFHFLNQRKPKNTV